MARNKWTREELIIAFNFYCKIPFTKINASNPEVKELANIVDRSVNAAALKLANFARLDPDLQKRDISGMSHGSKGEEKVWEEFHDDWESLAFESEKLIAKFQQKSLENLIEDDYLELPEKGEEREAYLKTRVNQNYFRKAILASYDNKCCITGIDLPQLLVGSHIKPWKDDEKNRMNPRNGLCLNALHDKAFDRGFMTITTDYKIKISDMLYKLDRKFFKVYEGNKIQLPQKFYPDKEFLEHHNDVIFLG